MSNDSRSIPFPFLQLPTELRLEVYDHAFQEYLIDRRPQNKEMPSTPVLMIMRESLHWLPSTKGQSSFRWFHLNRSMRSEVMSHVFGTYTIGILHADLFAALRLFGPNERSKIRHLHILDIQKEYLMVRTDAETFIGGTLPHYYTHPRFPEFVDIAASSIRDLGNGPFSFDNLLHLTVEFVPNSLDWVFMRTDFGKEFVGYSAVVKALKSIRGLKSFKVTFPQDEFLDCLFLRDDRFRKAFASLQKAAASVAAQVTKPKKIMDNNMRLL